MLILLSVGIAAGGYLSDQNYMRRKFRVINALTILLEILLKNAKNESIVNNDTSYKQIIKHIGIAGDKGDNSYRSVGYKKAIRVAIYIYAIPLSMMIPIYLILFNC